MRLEGSSVDDTIEQALLLARNTGAEFIHPFDDLDVIAGQATVGLELLDDVPDLARVIVPLGGGGLASRHRDRAAARGKIGAEPGGTGVGDGGTGDRPAPDAGRVRLVGVQAASCAPYAAALAGNGRLRAPSAMTIADGIAVKRPGALTLPLLRELLDEVVTVEEDQIADAMVFLAERAKLVAEGAGAIAVAALSSAARSSRSPARPSRSSPGATSTAACSRRCCCATKPRRVAACASSRACPTGRAGSPSCSG